LDTVSIAEALARLASAICKMDNEAFIVIAVNTSKTEAVLKTDLADEAVSDILRGMIQQRPQIITGKSN
jgi:hypothetical protein